MREAAHHHRDRDTSRVPFVGGATFGAAGAYERSMVSRSANSIRRHPANRGIVNIDKAPRNARGTVIRSDICILRPADPEKGNGRTSTR